MSGQAFSLAGDFPAVDEALWQSLVEQSLRGADFDKKINRFAEDGFGIKGLYPGTLNPSTGASFPDQPWAILQEHKVLGGTAANSAILDDLENGVNGLLLDLADGPTALDAALAGVLLDLVRLSFKAPDEKAAVVHQLKSMAEKQQIDFGQLNLSLGADPVTREAVSGVFESSLSAQIKELVEASEQLGANSHLFDINGAAYHHAGATDGQELAIVLSTAAAYLRAMEKEGLAVSKAANLISMTLAVDAEFFASIAKLRAARLLWSSLISACGLADQSAPAYITARSADRMFTRYDPWVNMLRGTAACFAGAVGGSNAVTIMPYDYCSGENSAFGRRIARNVQSVLMEESSLEKVMDPACGSGFLETFTHSLAEEAWAQFQEIEAAGGIEAVLKTGSLQEKIKAAQRARAKKIATRRKPITGVSEFPNIEDEVQVFAAARAQDTKALVPCNLAADFEALRDRAQKLGEPKVFLATLGDLAAYTPRATFAKNFFEAGGIRSISGGEFKDSAASIAVICGTDQAYQEGAIKRAQELLDGGAMKVFLAGAPGERQADYEKAGIHGFIHLGVDVPGILAPLLDEMEKAA